MPLTTIYGGSPSTRVIGDATAIEQTLHPAVMNYINRLVANGFNPTVNQIDAINNLVWTLVSNGIYSKLDFLYPVLGTTTSTAGLDLLNAYNLTFDGSWTFASTGMKITTANTANRARTGYNVNTAAILNDFHMSVYVRNSTASTAVIFGCIFLISPGVYTFAQINASTTSASGNVIINSSASGIVLASSITNSAGFHIGNRSASNATQYNINGVQNNTSSAASTTKPNLELTLGSRRNNEPPAGYDFPSTQEIAFASAGKSLTAIEQKIYYTAVQAYQTKLGRQV